MVRFHRLVVPMREAVSSLMRREHAAVSEELYPYYQDVYDHILRVSESTDSLRDLVSTIVETNLSLRDYRQNQIVKKVSSWAAIIAVPALITGYYGMNVPYPGSGKHLGCRRLNGAHHRLVGGPLPDLPPSGLALSEGLQSERVWLARRFRLEDLVRRAEQPPTLEASPTRTATSPELERPAACSRDRGHAARTSTSSPRSPGRPLSCCRRRDVECSTISRGGSNTSTR